MDRTLLLPLRWAPPLVLVAAAVAAPRVGLPPPPLQERATGDAEATADRADLAAAAFELLDLECLECHGGRRTKSALDLTTRAGALAGGERGRLGAVDGTGTPLLLAMTSYRDEDHQMPPSGVLPDADRELLARWLAADLPYPAGHEGDADEAGGGDADGPRVPPRGDGLAGWAYRPLVRPAVPGASSGGSPVDGFLGARLEAAGLEPVPSAGARDFLRRATFDLTGLPPTPSEVARFQADWARDEDGAVAALVERLLASPHYGEKWGRHWLDLVRYAETNGFERDADKPHVWRYRDWVVDALNRDLPYDRFVRAQLAGDEIAARRFLDDGGLRPGAAAVSEGDDDRLGNLVATGFYRLVQWDDEPGQGRLQARYDTLADVLATTGEAFLGTTMGCARCHDHPADPIAQEEYYAMMAFLHGVTDMSVDGYVTQVQTPETRGLREVAERARDEAVAALRDEVRAKGQEIRALMRTRRGGALTRSASGLVGGSWRFYRDTFEALPDFDALRPEDEGLLEDDLFSLAPRTRDEAIGFVQEATLEVPPSVDGSDRRAFRLVGGDAARLWVDGREVLAYTAAGEGAPGALELELAPGPHSLRLEWIHRTGTPRLVLEWRPQPPPVWRTSPVPPAKDWIAPAYDDGDWVLAPGGFGRADTPGARVASPWGTPDLWLRGSFVWTGDAPGECVLLLHHDDDAEVWVNGVPALTAEGFRTDYGVYALAPEARDTLRPGLNHLALHVRNEAGAQFVDVRAISRGDLVGRGLDDVLAGWRALSRDALHEDEEARALRQEAERDQEVVAMRKALRIRQRELDRLRAAPLPGTGVAAVQEAGTTPEPLHVHVRGSAAAPGAPVEPAFPAALGGNGTATIEPLGVDHPSSGRRLALARWITAPDHPLFARVLANRLWQHHFGRGLVASPNDLGELGERPTHPALLDWLASELVAQGFRLKPMHRLLMTSQAYRRASVASGEGLAVDPTNALHWRYPLRRLTAEEVRDAMLAVSGELVPRLGGESFFEPVPSDVLATASRPDDVWGTSPVEETLRRSLYIKVKRSLRPPLLVAFDAADTDAPCAARFETVQPSQALTLLNSAFARDRAAALAERLRREVGTDDRARIERARVLALGRPPSEAELDRDLAFLRELREDEGLSEAQAWEDLCLLFYNLAEFTYLD